MTFSNSTPFTSGNIMLGYCDAYDSIMGGNSGVVYDNVRVVSLAGAVFSPATVTFSGTGNANVTTRFTFSLDEPTSAFKLQKAVAVVGPYADTTATITKVSPGVYTATTTRAPGDATAFYRVRYIP